MDKRYAPPRAPVGDVLPSAARPGESPTISIRGRIHLALASAMLLAYAAYVLNWVVTWKGWGWLIAVVILITAGGLLLLRHPWARYPVVGSAALYVGLWLYVTGGAVADTIQTKSLLFDVLMFVPGIALVVAPSVYCVYVSRTYVRRS